MGTCYVALSVCASTSSRQSQGSAATCRPPVSTLDSSLIPAPPVATALVPGGAAAASRGGTCKRGTACAEMDIEEEERQQRESQRRTNRKRKEMITAAAGTTCVCARGIRDRIRAVHALAVLQRGRVAQRRGQWSRADKRETPRRVFSNNTIGNEIGNTGALVARLGLEIGEGENKNIGMGTAALQQKAGIRQGLSHTTVPHRSSSNSHWGRRRQSLAIATATATAISFMFCNSGSMSSRSRVAYAAASRAFSTKQEASRILENVDWPGDVFYHVVAPFDSQMRFVSIKNMILTLRSCFLVLHLR